MIEPEENEGMHENVRIRMFSEMKNKIKEKQKEHPERWANDSHFVRAAIINYFNQLEKE